jgi:hypothetical protein
MMNNLINDFRQYRAKIIKTILGQKNLFRIPEVHWSIGRHYWNKRIINNKTGRYI